MQAAIKRRLGTKITPFHISVVKIRVGMVEKQKIASYKLESGFKFTPYTTKDDNCDGFFTTCSSVTVPLIVQGFLTMKVSKIANLPFRLSISSAKSIASFVGQHNESNSAHSPIRTKFRQAII